MGGGVTLACLYYINNIKIPLVTPEVLVTTTVPQNVQAQQASSDLSGLTFSRAAAYPLPAGIVQFVFEGVTKAVTAWTFHMSYAASGVVKAWFLGVREPVAEELDAVVKLVNPALKAAVPAVRETVAFKAEQPSEEGGGLPAVREAQAPAVVLPSGQADVHGGIK